MAACRRRCKPWRRCLWRCSETLTALCLTRRGAVDTMRERALRNGGMDGAPDCSAGIRDTGHGDEYIVLSGEGAAAGDTGSALRLDVFCDQYAHAGRVFGLSAQRDGHIARADLFERFGRKARECLERGVCRAVCALLCGGVHRVQKAADGAQFCHRAAAHAGHERFDARPGAIGGGDSALRVCELALLADL